MSALRQFFFFFLNWDSYIPLWAKRIITLIPFIFVLYSLIFFYRSSHFVSFLTNAKLASGWIYFLSASIILMGVNWFFEALKWKNLVVQSVNISIYLAIKAVLYGTSLGLITPNRVGDFSGRSLLLPQAYRTHGVSATIFSSLSQNIPTFLFGAISCFLLFVEGQLHSFRAILFAGITLGLFGAGLFTTVLFCTSSIASFFDVLKISSAKQYFVRLAHRFPTSVLLRIGVFSHIRYLIFIVQFWLIANIFIDLNLSLVFECMAATYLSNTVLPTNQLVELGVRIGMPAFILSFYGIAAEPIAIASFILWLVNLALPGLIGALISSSVKDSSH